MELIADILLATGALGAGFYCYILGRRLKKFNDLKEGVGGAVAILSAQVDDLERTLNTAQTTAAESAKLLTELTIRAEETARKLELQMASLHDVAGPSATSTPMPNIIKEQEPVPPKASEPMFVRRRSEAGAA